MTRNVLMWEAVVVLLSIASSMQTMQTIICPSRCTCQLSDVDGSNVVDCTRQGIHDVPDISTLQDLVIHRLELTQNAISNIRNGAFIGLNIQWLELDYNKVVTLSGDDFNGLEDSLEFLSLRGNSEMTSFEGNSLGRFRRLRTLNLVGLGTALVDIQPMFLGNLQSLEVLLLSENHITSMHNDSLRGLENLRELAMNECKLTAIPAAVGSLANLLDLSIENNNIVTLDRAILERLTKLKILRLSMNRALAPALTGGMFCWIRSWGTASIVLWVNITIWRSKYEINVNEDILTPVNIYLLI